MNIIPFPQRCEQFDKIVTLGNYLEMETSKDFSDEVDFLGNLLKSEFDLTVKLVEKKSLKPQCVEIRNDVSFAEEAYRLEISADGIKIAASSGSGVFYAGQTLRQLLTEYGSNLPELLIEDSPRFSWRGAMLDTCRNFYSVAFIKKFLDLMALHKLNRFHWHLTDDQAWRLEIPGHPNLTALASKRRDPRFRYERYVEGFYSAADVREVLDWAKDRHIVVVPEIETPGHASSVLSVYPHLGCSNGPFETSKTYGVFEDIFCAGNEEVFKFLGDVFDEVCRLFPGPWIHIGGDECPTDRWEVCPKCQKRMKESGIDTLHHLQGWFTNRVGEMVKQRGRTMIGWDEVLDGGCPEEGIVMSWRGIEGGIEAAQRGHRVIMSPQTKSCYLDHQIADSREEAGHLGVCTLEDSYSFDPIPQTLNENQRKLIMGAQANVWTELMYFSRQVEYMVFPRLCALSEVFWTSLEKKNWNDFQRRLVGHRDLLDRLDVSYNPTQFRFKAV